MESVGGDKHVTVGGEKDGQKSGEYSERTFKDRNVAVDNMLQVQAGDAKVLAGGGDGSGNLDLYVEGAWKTTVDGGLDLHVKGQVVAGVDEQLMVSADSADLKTAQGLAFDAGGELTGRSGSNILLTAVGTLCLKGAGGFVKIDGTGVWIVGNVVNINSGGSATQAPSLSLPGPGDAAKAGPSAPAGADGAKSGQKSC